MNRRELFKKLFSGAAVAVLAGCKTSSSKPSPAKVKPLASLTPGEPIKLESGKKIGHIKIIRKMYKLHGQTSVHGEVKTYLDGKEVDQITIEHIYV
jgi:hypothetical protein